MNTDIKLEIGDRVRMAPMWKYEEAIGTVVKKTSGDYIVVRWDDINGDWHYTLEQSKRIQVINE